MRKVVKGRGNKLGRSPGAFVSGNESEFNARFDRLLDAMAKTPALPRKKKRIAVRQVRDENFDD